MIRSIREKDWKYLKKIQPEMLNALCARINHQARTLLKLWEGSEYERYQCMHRHITDSDQIVADCFDDWRHSNIWLKIPLLRRQGLLTDEHLTHMTDDIKELLKKFDLMPLMPETGKPQDSPQNKE